MNEYEIVKWNLAVFPNANEKAYKDKLKEEIEEVLDCLNSESSSENLLNEIADVVIVSISFLQRIHNVTLSSIVKKKFRIVVDREYGEEDANGGRTKINK